MEFVRCQDVTIISVDRLRVLTKGIGKPYNAGYAADARHADWGLQTPVLGKAWSYEVGDGSPE